MKFYRKQPIEAEQFDGSEEMIDKYHIAIDSSWVVPYRINTIEGWRGVQVHAWIATGVKGEHWPIIDDVFKQTYAELPVIPQAVAKYIEMTRDEVMLFDALDAVLSGFGTLPDWISSNQDLFARAWLDGYQVEEDK
ncbi:DUF1642 domain-containing protein [Lactiplantibacillus plantarum]|uniref:DUF1642 domain-containing protein n=2 Tax=Lactiplantibacillus plantarum TaxID=1590 RepID=UPI0015598564|nr:DUF1642 domain-containing protein [Lactiplantibacillus plantarum]QRG93785.1 DUF1642 domain-containing protein [Lactiplantibacillus plantarum]BEI64687.1 putative prophage protein [Lactiplantibacillus plantarum]